MHIESTWRILTIGDGDLSFSHALKQKYPQLNLVATVLDTETALRAKYQYNAIDLLKALNVKVLFEFDATQPHCWDNLSQHFDVVIFQFPLIPSFTSKAEFEQSQYPINTLNRILLRKFIHYSQTKALDLNGPMLSYITSKDVKPYREWNIEGSLVTGLPYHYLGQSPFHIGSFPGYLIRNVDRDKHVKDTKGFTYVWSSKPSTTVQLELNFPHYLNEHYCTFCRAGRFLNEMDKTKHERAKSHKLMHKYEQIWQSYLDNESLEM
ncbi:putative orphan protein [Pseudoalteromonas luteoviolacea B = ATCC 29581]|nr:putative orphan protein [Pseudoalteromonas luteoviolacea B = ATCC 29581]